MSMTARFIFSLWLVVSACATSPRAPRETPRPPDTASHALNGPGQAGFPVIDLKSGSLLLEFDAFHSDIRYYRISFRHMNRDWTESGLLPGVYMTGMTEDLITTATPSTSQIPLYTAYSYRFPNPTIGFSRSGNYMLDVTDPLSGTRLFSMPFFITESEGEGQFSVRSFHHSSAGTRITHQPVLHYRYADGLVMAHLDIHTVFVQNRWFDRMRAATLADMSEDGLLLFHLPESQAFPGSFDIHRYVFSGAGTLQADLAEVDASRSIPTVVKNPDVFGLTPVLQGDWTNRPGPNRSRDARYGLVTFRLENRPDPPVHLVGTFNQWKPTPGNRMRWVERGGYWEATVLLKEGTHTYAYLPAGESIPLNGLHSGSTQEYTAFVYRHDTAHRYDRLVRVHTVRTRQ